MRLQKEVLFQSQNDTIKIIAGFTCGLGFGVFQSQNDTIKIVYKRRGLVQRRQFQSQNDTIKIKINMRWGIGIAIVFQSQNDTIKMTRANESISILENCFNLKMIRLK